MRKQALALALVFVIFAATAEPVGAWSLGDLLKGTVSKALDLFKREVMPVDGYQGVRTGESFIIEGAHWYNPDYYIYLNNASVRFSWWIPREVTVSVTVYKVYFGIFAFKYARYDDIWWTKKQVGDEGWIGAFFVWVDWKRSGWSEAKKAYIAYNLPSAQDLNVRNMTILENGTVKLLFENNTTQMVSFEDFEGFGNITVENVTYKHVFGGFYLVKKRG